MLLIWERRELALGEVLHQEGASAHLSEPLWSNRDESGVGKEIPSNRVVENLDSARTQKDSSAEAIGCPDPFDVVKWVLNVRVVIEIKERNLCLFKVYRDD